MTLAKGPNSEKDNMVRDPSQNNWGLTGEGQFGKRTKWSMTGMVKDQMLEDEMANDEMGEDKVAWYRFKPTLYITRHNLVWTACVDG